jgi:hypothetical protein
MSSHDASETATTTTADESKKETSADITSVDEPKPTVSEDAFVAAITKLTEELKKMEMNKRRPGKRASAKKLAETASNHALKACPATTPIGQAGRLISAHGAALGVIHAVRLSNSPVAEPAAAAAIAAAKLYAVGVQYKDQSQRIAASTSMAIRRVLEQCLSDWPRAAQKYAMDVALNEAFEYKKKADASKPKIEVVNEPSADKSTNAAKTV